MGAPSPREDADDDDEQSMAPSSPAVDQDMALMELETPVQRLLKLSATESEGAMKEKVHRDSNLSIMEEIMAGKELPEIIKSLPVSGSIYIRDEVSCLLDEAEKFGVNPSKVGKTVIEEIRRVLKPGGRFGFYEDEPEVDKVIVGKVFGESAVIRVDANPLKSNIIGGVVRKV